MEIENTKEFQAQLQAKGLVPICELELVLIASHKGDMTLVQHILEKRIGVVVNPMRLEKE